MTELRRVTGSVLFSHSVKDIGAAKAIRYPSNTFLRLLLRLYDNCLRLVTHDLANLQQGPRPRLQLS